MPKQEIVWVIDDDASMRWVLEKAFQQANLAVRCFGSADEALDLLPHQQPDVVITDIRMPGVNGLELLQTLQREVPGLPVIIITAHSDLDSAVSAYRGGAFEYLPKPFDVDDAVALARRALEHRRSRKSTTTATTTRVPEILGKAAAMQEVFRAIGRLSGSNLNVLLNGESGTGKELVARALHNHSPRAKGPFIAINIAAIPRELLESELFGHERGAFTGAVTSRKGRFEQANGGTLFLDEIGDMPSELQTRLLRVLSDGKFYPVGGYEQISTDVRIIAATNQNLDQRVQEGRFREDLFHRLNVIRIHTPPLRDRREDIPLLARYFLKHSAAELGVETKQLLADVEEYLCSLPWPGNVRQLENTCRRLTVMAPTQTIHLEDLPSELLQPEVADQRNDWQNDLRRLIDQRLARGETDILSKFSADFERILIKAALEHTGGRKQDAAKKLGWGRNTLTRKIKDLDL